MHLHPDQLRQLTSDRQREFRSEAAAHTARRLRLEADSIRARAAARRRPLRRGDLAVASRRLSERAAGPSAARRRARARGAPGGVPARRGAELRQHRGDVVLGRPRRDDEPLGDLRVREPVGDEREHLELAGGQARRVRTRRLARARRNAQPELAHPSRRRASSAARPRARGRSRAPRRATPRRRAATASGLDRRSTPRRRRRRPLLPSPAGAWRRAAPRSAGSISTVDPCDGRPRRHADRAPAAGPSAAAGSPRAACASRSSGIGVSLVSAHSISSSSTGTIRCGSFARTACEPRGRPAARRHPVAAAHGQLGEDGLGHELGDGDALVDLGLRDRVSASSHSPARRRSHASVTAMYEARLCTSFSSA